MLRKITTMALIGAASPLPPATPFAALRRM